MSTKQLPYPFDADAPIPPAPPLFDGDPYMTGWWNGYHRGIDTGQYRAEVDRLTRWQRWRLVRMCIRSLDRKDRLRASRDG